MPQYFPLCFLVFPIPLVSPVLPCLSLCVCECGVGVALPLSLSWLLDLWSTNTPAINLLIASAVYQPQLFTHSSPENHHWEMCILRISSLVLNISPCVQGPLHSCLPSDLRANSSKPMLTPWPSVLPSAAPPSTIALLPLHLPAIILPSLSSFPCKPNQLHSWVCVLHLGPPCWS